MSSDDIIAVVPWLICAACIAAVCWRLTVSRMHSRGRHRPGGQPGKPGAPGA